MRKKTTRLCFPRRLVLLFLGVYLLSGPFRSNAAPPSPQGLFQEDKRLDQKVTVEEVGISLGELLTKLSRPDLTLKAGRSCTEQKLQLRLKNRPIRVLMQSLTQLLPGVWEPLNDKQGYELHLTPTAIRQREEWWKLYQDEREKAMAELRKQVLQQMRQEFRSGPPPVEEGTLDTPEQQEHRERERRHREFFRQLPPSLQERIAAQINDTPFFSLYTLQFSSLDEEGALVVPFSGLSETSQQMIRQERAEQFPNVQQDIAWENAYARFTNSGFCLMGRIFFPAQTGKSIEFPTSINLTSRTSVLSLEQNDMVKAVQQLGKNAPKSWKRLAEFRQKRVWSNDPPAEKSRRVFTDRPLRPEALRRLRDKADIEFVADYYSLPGKPLTVQEKNSDLKRPLKAELDFLAAEQDTSWKQHSDGVYLLRHNRWYRNDRLEVPASLLKKWLALRLLPKLNTGLARTEPIIEPLQLFKKYLDWQAEAVSQLSLWQIAVGLRWFHSPPVQNQKGDTGQTAESQRIPEWMQFPFQIFMDTMLRQVNTIRFYASLDENRRATLMAGRLPAQSLTIPQQQQALALLPEFSLQGKQPPGTSVLLGLQLKSDAELPTRHNDVLQSVVIGLRLTVTSPQTRIEAAPE
jgi:hypothetical protein